MPKFLDFREFLARGGRRRCSVLKKKLRWLHVNGHRSESEHILKGHD